MHSRLASEPDETRLLLIKKIAREDKNKRYRHMMDEIVAALGSGKELEEWMKGFGSVCMTIGRAF
jgi:type II secretory pathway component PulF